LPTGVFGAKKQELVSKPEPVKMSEPKKEDKAPETGKKDVSNLVSMFNAKPATEAAKPKREVV